MRIINDPSQYRATAHPIILTIGNFDGVHLGHQALLQQVVKAKGPRGQGIALTFSNHPAEVLRAQQIPALCTPSHKLKLLQDAGIDTVISIPFTIEFSQQRADEFLLALRRHIPFSNLVLGHDAAFGHNRNGDRSTVEEISRREGFDLTYIEQATAEGTPISSTAIRKLIQQGALDEAAKLLGRTYSIFGPVERGAGKGKDLGFPTLNINAGGLCVPPYGVYASTTVVNGIWYPGVSNLGVAPMVRNDSTPILETFLFNFSDSLYGQNIEVQLKTFLRSERTFPSISALKEQIALDVSRAKKLF